MRGLGFATVMVALIPSHGLAQEYTNATNAAWCAGALGTYAQSSEVGLTYLDHARSRQFAFAQEFFGARADKGATMLIFENLGREGAAECNRACAVQQKSAARAACFDASPDCKRIVVCLADVP